MSEPIENQDVLETIEPTPEISEATPEVEPQPVVEETIVPEEEEINVQAELEESTRLAKRYKEQLAGKDKLIESLQTDKIVESLQPVENTVPEEYSEEQAPVQAVPLNPQQRLINKLTIQNAVVNNELTLERKYGQNQLVPYTTEVRDQVHAVLDKWDKTGAIKLNPEAWEVAYDRVAKQKLEGVIESEKQKAVDEVTATEITKAAASVESSTKPEDISATPSLEDVVSGKVEMSASEMIKTFPELTGQFERPELL